MLYIFFKLKNAVVSVLEGVADVVKDGRVRAFVALARVFEIFVEFEHALVFAVDSVVGQMHEQIIEVFLAGLFVIDCAESSQAFVEQVDGQGVDRLD